ncbi:hypothetical protein BS47DRAFT_1377883 [Hydnum rufescens UP504]|uniref:Mitochondrial carrier n=1 Tax=Hydnum rufescens UP504 TaxID=1448309 RepID=A0A9P6AKN2_9AGAM|nr:hypothetical protein BS47DRAFT_1377883 [Hydnum rufescens UP504]
MSQEGGKRDHTGSDNSSIYAAVTRSLLRGVTVYFSRPVRLFRPVKASGWTSLRNSARRDGETLSPKYLNSLIKQHGVSVIPRHFFPPLLINACLGTLLFTSYTSMSSTLCHEFPHASTTLIASISGASAGAIQAIAGAPADNARILMEHGVFHPEKSVSGWRHAWKEVFLRTESPLRPSRSAEARVQQIREMREVREWMHEVREMAGRGWDGWGWGLAKDVLGFALFFAVFDISRKAALQASSFVERSLSAQSGNLLSEDEKTKTSKTARMTQGTVLVTGGVVAGLGYEIVGRPFDAIRREWHISSLSVGTASQLMAAPPKVAAQSRFPPLLDLVLKIVREEGMRGLFRGPSPSVMTSRSSDASGWRSRVYPVLRALARVGPWGIGFLVWEALGPGIQ